MSDKKLTFKIESLGCKVNSYECASLKALFLKRGYLESAKDEQCDIALLNTCSVTATADQKSRQYIRRLKKENPQATIVVMGCYSQGHHRYIADEIKADIIVGTSNRHMIPELIERFRKTEQAIDLTEDNPRKFEYEELSVTSFTENVRAYLKIQDGCDNFCSYCIIPFVRGKMRSRAKEDILLEARSLIEKGYKEIVLTGIHVGGYGRDLSDYTFSDLLEELSALEGLERLTISSLEDSEIDDKFYELLKIRKNIARHLHIPLQSGSETVLKRMNRKYDKKAFLNTIKKIKRVVPEIALTTDIIVGFPGETEEEFLETFNFIKEVGFSMLHVFPFSAREGTLAAKMKNQVSPEIKKERTKRLRVLSSLLWEEYKSKFYGRKLQVLIENYDENTKRVFGHSENYIEVWIKGDKSMINSIIEIKFSKDKNKS
ncbi:MAG: tRNA (N(6)-L-threonylcarbamoyladenosine(37)-C(2))-methylthiotransferase MtaB [Erysipelotrichia bacterium]|nr:tRNA (N(6)-L-threonylcarbamoyladenosine(37)-C(2))-methylthiotransferase MtaB [Erysipelotrichia bacterium]